MNANDRRSETIHHKLDEITNKLEALEKSIKKDNYSLERKCRYFTKKHNTLVLAVCFIMIGFVLSLIIQ